MARHHTLLSRLGRRSKGRMFVFSGIAGAGLMLASWQAGTAQVRRDVDPDRPPVTPPAAPPVERDLRRGLPPEDGPSPVDSPATRPATMTTFTGKVAVVEADDDKITLLVGDEEEKTFTVADDAKITLNSKPARLRDLQLGDVLKVAVHKTEPSVAMNIVAARVTETSQESSQPPRYSVVDTEGPKGGGQQGGQMRSMGTVGGVMPFQGRVFVMQIQAGTPAAELGLQPGDTILIVGSDGLLPTNANLRGGQANAAQLQSGLVVVPPGAMEPNQVGGAAPGAVRGAAGVQGSGAVVAPGVAPGAVAPVVPFVGPGVFPGAGTQNGNNQDGNNQNGNNQNGNNQNGNNPGAGTNNPGTGAAGNRSTVTPGGGAANADRNTQGTGGRATGGTVTPGSGAAAGGIGTGNRGTGTQPR